MRQKGEVASSKDLSGILVLAACMLTLSLSLIFIYEILSEYIEWLYGLKLELAFTEKVRQQIAEKSMIAGLKCVAPVFISALCVGVFSNIVQVGFLFEKVLKKSQEWANDEQMMYVVGATQGEMFIEIRKYAPNHFLLVPGVGAQGGSLEEVCKYGMNNMCGLIVNSSRAIIYADKTELFAEAARKAAKEVQEQMAIELKRLV
jgi:hypothetical protein